MNFNYVLHTGDTTITGSSFDIYSNNNDSTFGTNFDSLYASNSVLIDSKGDYVFWYFGFEGDIVTGRHCSILSYNSQTLLEETPTLKEVANFKQYQISTGNYLVDVTGGGNNFYIAEDLTLSGADVVIYDGRPSGESIPKYKTDTTNGSWNTFVSDLLTSIDSEYTIGDFESGYYLFFNGQKLHDYLDHDNFDEATGIGFAINKPEDIVEFATGEDLYGEKFIEHGVEFYINGMRQQEKTFLQLYTGVSHMIETGVKTTEKVYNLTGVTYSL